MTLLPNVKKISQTQPKGQGFGERLLTSPLHRFALSVPTEGKQHWERAQDAEFLLKTNRSSSVSQVEQLFNNSLPECIGLKSPNCLLDTCLPKTFEVHELRSAPQNDHDTIIMQIIEESPISGTQPLLDQWFEVLSCEQPCHFWGSLKPCLRAFKQRRGDPSLSNPKRCLCLHIQGPWA